MEVRARSHEARPAVDRRAPWRGLLAFAVGYATLQMLGFALADDAGTPMLWPAAGWAMAWYIAAPRPTWPAMTAVLAAMSVAGSWVHGDGLRMGLVLAALYAAEAMLGALLADGVSVWWPDLGSWQRLSAVLGLAVLANTLVMGLLGGAVYAGWGESAFVLAWRTWWMAHAVGIMAFGPAVSLSLIAYPRWPSRASFSMLDRRTIVLLLVVWAAWLAVFADVPAALYGASGLALLVPLLMWLAARGGFEAATLAVPVVAVAAVWGTLDGHGPLGVHTGSAAMRVFDTGIVVGALVAVALLIGALVNRLKAAVLIEVHVAEEQLALRQAEAVAVAERRRRRLAEGVSALVARLGQGAEADGDVWAWLARQPSLAADLTEVLDAEECTVLMRPEGHPSRLAVPEATAAVQRGETTIGAWEAGDAPVTAAIPLYDHSGQWQAVVVVIWAPGVFDAQIAQAVESFGDLLTRAVARATRLQASARAHEEAELLRFAAEALSSATTSLEVSRRAVNAIATRLGATEAWCALADGARLVPMAAQSSAPMPEALFDKVLRTGRPADADAPDGQRDLAMPLAAGARILGVAGIRVERAALGPSLRRRAQAIGDMVGLVLQRAQRFDTEHESVLALQRALLPAVVDAGPDVEVAVDYQPRAQHLAMGGDWYDVIRLPGGRVALMVGDVVGHGVAAAAVMGQLRTACAALAPTAAGAADLVEQLERFAVHIEGAQYATMAVVIFDTAKATLSCCLAGHPPPALVSPDGSVRLLDGVITPPLCAAQRGPRGEHHALLDPGTSLVLYSDGLIERRGEVIDAGIGRLQASIGAHLGERPPALVDHLLDEVLAGYETHDDLVLMVAQFCPVPDSAFGATFPADFSQLSALRAEMRAWLAAIDGFTVDDVLLAVGEAASNAIEHAYRSREPGKVEVRMWQDPDGSVSVSVRDFGRWQQRPALGNRGRGLLIMQTVSAMRRHSDASGTVVRLRFFPYNEPVLATTR